MSKIKTILIFFLLSMGGKLYCQYPWPGYGNAELLVINQSVTNMNIAVTIYPVSMIINGYNNYDLMAKTRQVNEYGHTTYYVNTVEIVVDQGIDKITTWIL